jgi:hypothetical protein
METENSEPACPDAEHEWIYLDGDVYVDGAEFHARRCIFRCERCALLAVGITYAAEQQQPVWSYLPPPRPPSGGRWWHDIETGRWSTDPDVAV